MEIWWKKMTPMQILALIYSIFMIFLSYTSYKRKELDYKEFIFWSSLWVGVLILIVFPGLFLVISMGFKYNRILDIAYNIAFLIIFLIVFQMYKKINILNKSIENIVRQIALANIEDFKDHDKKGKI